MIFVDGHTPQRRWLIDIDSLAVIRARQYAGIDLCQPGCLDSLLAADDPQKATALLWAIASPWARNAGVERQGFSDSFSDPAIRRAALEAVAEAIATPADPPEPADEPTPRRHIAFR